MHLIRYASLCRAFGVFAAFIAATACSHAQTIEWAGGNQNNMTTAANWNPSTALDATTGGVTVNFTTAINNTQTVLVGANPTIKAIFVDNSQGFFNNATTNFRISASNNNTTPVNRILTFGSESASNAIITLRNNANVLFNASTVGSSTSTLQINLNYSGYGTLDVDGTSSLTFNNANSVITGTGGLIKIGAGTLTINNAHTYAGNFELKEGTVIVTTNSINNTTTNTITSSAFGTGALILSGGTLQSNNITVNRNFANPVFLNGTVSLGNTGNPVALAINSAINAGTTLLQNSTLHTLSNVIWQQAISGNHSITKTGEGTLAFGGNSNASTYNGFELVSGTVTFTSSGNSSIDNAQSSFGTGTLTISGGVITSSNNAGGGGNRTLYNPISLNGTATLGAADSLSGMTISTSWGSSTTLLRNSTINTPGAQMTWNQDISGAYSLTKTGSGTLVLGGNNSYTGGTFINEGAVRGDGASLQGNIVNNTTLTFNETEGGTYAGNLSGSGSVTKEGAGTLSITGNLTHTGGTTVTAGTLRVNGSVSGFLQIESGGTLAGTGTLGGSVTIAGTHAPGGSPGIQTFAGDLTYQSGATVAWELFGNTVGQGEGANYDQILVGGSLDFAGPITLQLAFSALGSSVDWTDPFWASDQSWHLYDANVVNNFHNFSIAIENWEDSEGNFFDAALAGSGFSLSAVGTDIYLNYTAGAIPEPATTAALLGVAALALAAWRRRTAAHDKA